MSKRFSADINELHEILKYVERAIIEAGFVDPDKYLVELAVEEAVVNIINYAYPSKDGEIEIDYKILENSLTITVMDSGKPFNPLDSGRMRDQGPYVNKEFTGGYGISFMLKIIDELEYFYENNKNVLVLKKYRK